MNVQEILSDLQNLHGEWEVNSAGPDLIDRHEWARGVVHGIKIAIHRVSQHVTPPASIRVHTGKLY